MVQNQSSFQVYNASAGSGKTFTLVKEYLKILLSTPDSNSFQQILAVTFTNKAAAEMKDRVIQNLREFAKNDILVNKSETFLLLENELSISDQTLHIRAKKVLHSILDNYSAFHITTIDSFTYRLIRSFAFDLGLPLNFEVEMDAKSLLNEAVELMISKIGEDKELTKVLVEFSLQKANEDKSWDITYDLKEIAQILLNENDQIHVQKAQDRPIKDYLLLKNKLVKRQISIERQIEKIGKEALEIIEKCGLQPNDFYRSMLPNHFNNLVYNLDKANFFDQNKLKERLDEGIFYAKSKPTDVKLSIDNIIGQLLNFYNSSEELYQDYILNKLFLSSLIPLAVLSNINKMLNELKEEKNIRLNAEFNQIISKNLQEQPVAFIYERLGEKFKHYFIDEMQDTSILQWQNMLPLVENALSQEGTSLLLVGDTKQAIYRWRGSEPEQFLDLSLHKNSQTSRPFFVDKNIKQLGTNYRSFSEVINFNNDFFKHVASFFNKKQYADIYLNENNQKHTTKKGGYVQISFIEEDLAGEQRDIAYANKTLQIIKNLDNTFSKNEICVLTRTRKQGVFIADFLTDNGIEIISSETLLLNNSDKAIFIVNLLTFLQNSANKEAKLQVLYFLYDYLELKTDKHEFFEDFLHEKIDKFFMNLQVHGLSFDYKLFIQQPFYEAIEYIIRVFKLNTSSDAYLQFFLDEVLQFSHKKSSDINAFLEYWEEKKDSISIVVPEEKDAVRIMTIHKAKGLEFPVVVYPYDLDIYKEQNPRVWYPILDKEDYNNFDSLLVNCNKSLEQSGELGNKLYNQHRDELELDNFNLLYVAFTRAIEHLYLIPELKQITNTIRTSSQFLMHYLESIQKWDDQQKDYYFGNAERISERTKTTKKSFELSNLLSSSWQSHNINIVASSALLWDTEKGKSILYGNLIHDLLAHIKTADDIDEILKKYIDIGNLKMEEKESIKNVLLEVVNHPELSQYFMQNIKVMNEREILTSSKEIVIPDRIIMNDNNEVVILDYKTGKPEEKYRDQINNYAHVIGQIGFIVTRKLLVYIGETITIDEV
ncbi:MAG: UvrD-helicase domain-containing protein, partial [Flavobacteriaceae bacterium]|nr:UvrD-helicase domain-containing protein [Flavobacteriaceae bacterium]